MLPNETQERKKRFLKDRRKQLLDQISTLHASSAKHPQQGGKSGKGSGHSKDGIMPLSYNESGLKGFGRRLNLKEMLILHKFTREETRSQLGVSYMPAGTKPTKT